MKHELLRQLDRDFSAWWNDPQRPYSLGDRERTVYHALREHRQETAESLSQQARLSYGEVADALEVLVGTGVIQKVDDELWAIGSRLFEEWVVQQQPKIQT
jgi:predicted transcriptional regulator